MQMHLWMWVRTSANMSNCFFDFLAAFGTFQALKAKNARKPKSRSPARKSHPCTLKSALPYFPGFSSHFFGFSSHFEILSKGLKMLYKVRTGHKCSNERAAKN